MTGRHNDLTAWQELVQRVQTAGWPHGREQSFKMLPGRLLRDRLLLGIPRTALAAPQLWSLARELGMPPAAQDLLAGEWDRANAVFLACEESGAARMLKVYLEFWDEVRRAVRRGERAPQLLHLGAKWSSTRPGHHEEARYLVHPLIGLKDILRRMGGCYPAQAQATGLELARRIVRQAAMRAPQAPFLYLEASEADNPRHSFDINLYKSGLRVGDVAGELRELASHFGLERDFEPVLQELAGRPLGHVSGGCDRHGAEFLSVYAEIAPLPDGP
ncbi:MAG TPA: hypothetical protein VGD76_00535, partial [Ramlibacter sp.]